MKNISKCPSCGADMEECGVIYNSKIIRCSKRCTLKDDENGGQTEDVMLDTESPDEVVQFDMRLNIW